MTGPLVQHRVSHGEPWRVVVASMLLCRTRGDVAEPVIRAVFRRWPSAEGLSRATALERVIEPLGLARVRAPRIRAVAETFARDRTPPAARVAMLPGCGKYVTDAYRLIVLGDLTVEPEDHALAAYLGELR